MTRIAVVFCLLLAVVAAAPKNHKTSSIAGKIVGGRDTEISEVPYTVSLQKNRKHYCGGSIIAPKYVLTAAHCVRGGSAPDYSIRAGSKLHGSGGVTRKVKAIIKHPDYDIPNVDNDIAILELINPLPKSKRKVKVIQAIALAKKEPKDGDQVLVSGWGALEEKGTAVRSLVSATIPVVDREACKKIHEGKNNVTENMFCAGYTEGGKDACKGDSGGPAVVDGLLAGIISWGRGCGRENTPGAYTNIVKYLDWINTKTHSED